MPPSRMSILFMGATSLIDSRRRAQEVHYGHRGREGNRFTGSMIKIILKSYVQDHLLARSSSE
jgi:hypothetical protein